MSTIDNLGDSGLTAKLIARDISDIDEMYCSMIGKSAFRGCDGLEKICTSATQIHENAFRGCSALASLVLRSTSVCKLHNSNALAETPIANGNGYIYVPTTLFNTYCQDGDWSVYFAKIRNAEQYPKICSPLAKYWTRIPSARWSTPRYANGVWIIGDTNGGGVHRSTDDMHTWTTVTKTPSRLSNVNFADGIWVGSYQGIYYSEDNGLTWVAAAGVKTQTYTICRFNDVWVALVSSSSSTYKGAYYSYDGKQWTLGDSEIYGCFSLKVTSYGILACFSNGSGAGIWFSSDGKQWIQTNVTSGQFAFTFAEGLCVAYDTSYNSKKGIWYSSDGQTWIQSNVTNIYIESVDFGEGRWIGVCSNSSATGLYKSDDGQTWIFQQTDVQYFKICFANHLWFLTSANQACAYSVDGDVWEESSLANVSSLSTVSYEGGILFVGLTSSNRWYLSRL